MCASHPLLLYLPHDAIHVMTHTQHNVSNWCAQIHNYVKESSESDLSAVEEVYIANRSAAPRGGFWVVVETATDPDTNEQKEIIQATSLTLIPLSPLCFFFCFLFFFVSVCCRGS